MNELFELFRTKLFSYFNAAFFMSKFYSLCYFEMMECAHAIVYTYVNVYVCMLLCRYMYVRCLYIHTCFCVYVCKVFIYTFVYLCLCM